jgi:hypothetical protein
MDEKLKKLARKVSGLILSSETPQIIYDELTVIANKQKDYFNYLGPDNLIKLVFYIYSIKNTNNFILGDKMINNLSFIKLVETEGNHTVYDCTNCGGGGYINCDICNGNGEVECEECDGDREVDGEYCDVCDGHGHVDCGGCLSGEVECEECDGNGEIESETDYVFFIKHVVTWDSNIANVCELRETDNVPAMSEYDFDRLRDDYILLFIDEDSEPLNILENELYCIKITTEPDLRFVGTMQVKFRNDFKQDIIHLLS